MKKSIGLFSLLAASLLACSGAEEEVVSPQEDVVVEQVSQDLSFGSNDEKGNANLLGYATRLRCAVHLALPNAKTYELGHVYEETMPSSPVGDAPVNIGYKPTSGIPYTSHVGNGETGGAVGSQGTQFDALGHFGFLPNPWFGAGEVPVANASYYNGFTQAQVKPTPASPLLKLGVEKAPPIMTTAVILDAKQWYGAALPGGFALGETELKAIMQQQGLTQRGILPGDAVFIRTGWGERWDDGDGVYYSQGPGLTYQGAEFLAKSHPVVVGLDNPFTDAAPACFVQGTCMPPFPTLPNLPTSVHHTLLVKYGIHQIQNMNLTEIADDNVKLACAFVVPLRIKGAAGSPVRPFAVGKKN